MPGRRCRITLSTVALITTLALQPLCIDLAAHLSDQLLIRGSLGYLDSKFDKFLDPDPKTGVLEDISDSAELRRVPKWTYNIGADYQWPVLRGTLTARVHYSFRDDYFSSPVRRQQDPLGRDMAPHQQRTDFFPDYELPLRDPDTRLNIAAFFKDAFGDKLRRLGATNAGLFWFGQRATSRHADMT
jgi:hypothetical protein